MKKQQNNTDWGLAEPQSVSRGVSLSGINILKFYFQNSNWSLQCQHFFTTFAMSSVGIMNIFLTILVVLSPEGLQKTYIDFSNNTFPIDTVTINVFHYISQI